MAAASVPCMNSGDKETSYGSWSLPQEMVLSKARPILEDTIKDMFSNVSSTDCIKVADLGCSSGPNTFMAISIVVDAFHEMCQQAQLKSSPEIQAFLNDLPENDFNSVFRSVASFTDRIKKEKGDKFGPCFVTGVPGSFYGRLFPNRSLHLVHSSYSVHWLSKVPDGIGNNKGYVYMAESSPPNVFKAYSRQFKEDFSTFLKLRSQEMIPGGRMVLTFNGRSNLYPSKEDDDWKLQLAKSLYDLVAEGIVKEADADSFNIPLYAPYKGELCEIIQKEGSFDLDKLEVVQINWGPRDVLTNEDFELDKYQWGQKTANSVRAITEPMLARHFGEDILDKLFRGLAKYEAEHPGYKLTSIVVSMKKK
ncbi:benzoate carboxyl methyltransferase-like [Herrania umbratica]|uniref:Benzoate carboxyl methyltransferase-like n=1 Tax=Herrania umbratica TaxID=108875 RepID=A0A6J1BP81_9ROSI|nr:benzoate carboxyl methyltransferase-like [Herrania umbratica]